MNELATADAVCLKLELRSAVFRARRELRDLGTKYM